MNLNFLEIIEKSIGKELNNKIKVEDIHEKYINKDELELAQKLDAIEEFTIDRFEEEMVVIENRKTKEMVNLSKNQIPEGCREGDILKCINGKYFLDKEKTEMVEKEIEEKFKNLWN